MFARTRSVAAKLFRRPRRASTYFLVAVLAVSATGGWYLWQAASSPRLVCVATTEIPAYHQITLADVQTVVLSAKATPAGATADPEALVGRYVLTAVPRDHAFVKAELGPHLRGNALAGQLIVGLPATVADMAGGAVAPGDRVDVLLSSMTPSTPRDGVLHGVLVLNVRADHSQSAQFVIVCAITEKDEDILLMTGGTARIFIASLSPNDAP